MTCRDEESDDSDSESFSNNSKSKIEVSRLQDINGNIINNDTPNVTVNLLVQ